MKRIAVGAFEPVLAQQPIGLHVSDHRLDHLAFEQRLQPLGQRTRVADEQPHAAGRLYAAVASIGKHDLGHVPRENADLFELAVHGMAVIRIAGHRSHAQHQALAEGDHHRHLHAELVRRPGIALLRECLHIKGRPQMPPIVPAYVGLVNGELVFATSLHNAFFAPNKGGLLKSASAAVCKPTSALRNGHLAGSSHPKTGIPFDEFGYPDFPSVVQAEVKIAQTGTRAGDFAAANKATRLKSTPETPTWHHHQDGTTMQLVPRARSCPIRAYWRTPTEVLKMKIDNPGPTLTLSEIGDFEKAAGGRLPEEYREFLLRFNGGAPDPNSVDVAGLPGSPTDVQVFFGIGRKVEASNVAWHIGLLAERFPAPTAIAVACDSGGSLFLLDLGEKSYGEIALIDVYSGDLYPVSKSFGEFVSSIRPLE